MWNFIITLVILHTSFCLPLEDAFGIEFVYAEINFYRKLIIIEIVLMVNDC
jgi:hypothetical protein